MNKRCHHTNLTLTGISILLACLCLTCCCGPRFQIAEAPNDNGIVYIYRPKKYFHGGLDYTVNANGFKIDTLHNGCYLPYIAKPGRIQISSRTEITSYVTLDIEAGETYYIKTSVRPGNMVGRPHLQLVSKEVGKKEIIACRLKKKKKDSGLEATLNNDPGTDKAVE